LPLALTIVAARVARYPAFPLATFAAELRPADRRLEALADGHVRGVFSWSYLALTKDAARLFRLLGLHPGPDLTAGAAAALAGLPAGAPVPQLAELTRLHLLTEHAPGRYAFHDLLRAYAAELARSAEEPADRDAARERLFDHYLHTAYAAAAVLLQPQWTPITPADPLPGTVPEPVRDHDSALAYFTAESQVLTGVVRLAAETGFETYAWQLGWTLASYFAPRGHWQDSVTVQRIALRAARNAGDRLGEATASRLLSRAELRLGDLPRAEELLRAALDLYTRLDDPTGQAQTLHNLAELCQVAGRTADAFAAIREALRLYRVAGYRPGEARTLNGLAWLSADAGDYAEAVARGTEALAVQRAIGDQNGQAATLDTLALAYHRMGDLRAAAGPSEQAVELFHRSADRFHEAGALVLAGDIRSGLGDPAAAAEAWQRALLIYEELGDPSARDVRRRLDPGLTGA
jgi:tetratricopeptide (TPR) repeat protein